VVRLAVAQEGDAPSGNPTWADHVGLAIGDHAGIGAIASVHDPQLPRLVVEDPLPIQPIAEPADDADSLLVPLPGLLGVGRRFAIGVGGKLRPAGQAKTIALRTPCVFGDAAWQLRKAPRLTTSHLEQVEVLGPLPLAGPEEGQAVALGRPAWFAVPRSEREPAWLTRTVRGHEPDASRLPVGLLVLLGQHEGNLAPVG